MHKGLMERMTRFTLVSVLGLVLVACGGGGNDGEGSAFDLNNNGSGSGGSSGGTGETAMGYISGGLFTPDLLRVVDATLEEGDSTSVSVAIVNENGTPISGSIDVLFSSDCVLAGYAQFTGGTVAGDGTTTRTITNGTGSVTYGITSASCPNDTIRATAQVNGKNLTAVAVIEVPSDPAHSIQVFSTTTTQLTVLSAISGAKNTDVTFKVTDADGDPLPDRLVVFDLENAPGGAELFPRLATSDAEGLVTTRLTSGTASTIVAVKAQVSGTNIDTVKTITISSGMPHPAAISLAATYLNPAVWNIDKDVASQITVRLSDSKGVAVPDGTQVKFSAEGGQLVGLGVCETLGGSCTMDWDSSDPRPGTDSNGKVGQVQILAVVIGNESFTDYNQNGMCDDGEFNPATDDRGEPYRDDNSNGTYDLGEPFEDANSNGIRDSGNGVYDGVLCNVEGGATCNATPIPLGKTITLNMADGQNAPVFTVIDDPVTQNPISPSGPGVYYVMITDANGNALPDETTIDATATDLDLPGGAKASSATSGPTFLPLVVLADDELDGGFIVVDVTMGQTGSEFGYLFFISNI